MTVVFSCYLGCISSIHTPFLISVTPACAAVVQGGTCVSCCAVCVGVHVCMVRLRPGHWIGAPMSLNLVFICQRAWWAGVWLVLFCVYMTTWAHPVNWACIGRPCLCSRLLVQFTCFVHTCSSLPNPSQPCLECTVLRVICTYTG